jgi:6,7-dimethyl-8-ribityllumazine synthase
MQQALERAGIKSNHGWDYALNALEMASLMRQFKEMQPSLAPQASLNPNSSGISPALPDVVNKNLKDISQ